MYEFLKNLLLVFGGGTAVLVGVFTVFKDLIIKYLEGSIESTFNKKLEQYRNSLYRSTKAYEIILNRELQYYEQLNLHLAELIPLVQDLVYYLKPNEYKNQIEQFEAFKKIYLRYLDLLLLLKNESLIFHLYTTKEIFQEVTSVIIQMQDDKHFWSEQGLLFNDKKRKCVKIIIKRKKNIFSSFLFCLNSYLKSYYIKYLQLHYIGVSKNFSLQIL